MGRAFEFRKGRKMKRWSAMAKAFTRIGKDIVMAVKEGGPNPDANSRLRAVMQNAKAANMPKENVERAIKKATEGYDLLLTHNFKGEYGHPHHLLINKAVEKIKIPKVYFGDYPDYYNLLYKYDEDPFDINEFWLHQPVLKDCDIRTYKYFVTDEAKAIL